MLNDARARATLQPSELTLLPDGTCANEALGLELKNLCIGQTMHEATLGMKLSSFLFKKQLAHTTALCHPTTVQLEDAKLLHRAVGAMDPWEVDGSWRSWCNRLKDAAGYVRSCTPNVTQDRCSQATRLEKWKVAMRRHVPEQAKTKRPKKRTVITLRPRSSKILQRAAKR